MTDELSLEDLVKINDDPSTSHEDILDVFANEIAKLRRADLHVAGEDGELAPGVSYSNPYGL